MKVQICEERIKEWFRASHIYDTQSIYTLEARFNRGCENLKAILNPDCI